MNGRGPAQQEETELRGEAFTKGSEGKQEGTGEVVDRMAGLMGWGDFNRRKWRQLRGGRDLRPSVGQDCTVPVRMDLTQARWHGLFEVCGLPPMPDGCLIRKT